MKPTYEELEAQNHLLASHVSELKADRDSWVAQTDDARDMALKAIAERDFLASYAERMKEALLKIEEWDCHPCEWELIDKVNFYRKMATEALSQPPPSLERVKAERAVIEAAKNINFLSSPSGIPFVGHAELQEALTNLANLKALGGENGV